MDLSFVDVDISCQRSCCAHHLSLTAYPQVASPPHYRTQKKKTCRRIALHSLSMIRGYRNPFRFDACIPTHDVRPLPAPTNQVAVHQKERPHSPEETGQSELSKPERYGRYWCTDVSRYRNQRKLLGLCRYRCWHVSTGTVILVVGSGS